MEEALLRAFIRDPMLFGRSAKTRQSDARRRLCEQLGLSHEQLEGWAILFERNVSVCLSCSVQRVAH